MKQVTDVTNEINQESKRIKVLNILQKHCMGRNRAMTASRIATLTVLAEREVREIISKLRRDGEPIASSINPPYGFFIPENEMEARECLNQFYSRIQETYKTVRSIEKGLKKKFPDGQGTLNLGDIA